MEPLDGNAAAGMLSEIFAVDVTSARGRCVSCGNEGAMGEVVVYMHAPGVVARCRVCGSVLFVLVRGRDRHWFGVPGMAWLELSQ
jgi:hypothetical protein